MSEHAGSTVHDIVILGGGSGGYACALRAAQLGLDVARFDRDRAGAAVFARIRRDVESGMASGEVRGTPTLFVDGVVHRGGYDAATLTEALAR